jgi:hypothetical protein
MTRGAGAGRRRVLHDAFLELHVGDAAFVGSRDVGSDEPLGDRSLVFAQSCGDTRERSQPTGTELVEPVRQRCGTTGIEHGGELTDKVVGAAQLGAVLE